MNKLLLLFLVVFTITGVTETIAKRSSADQKRREKAIDFIRKNSDEVSDLLGVDPFTGEVEATPKVELISIGDHGEDLEELANTDDIQVDLETFTLLWTDFLSEDDEVEDFTDNGLSKSETLNVIMDWLGTKYRFGGQTKRGIDCSAFTRTVYKDVLGVELPRTAYYQYQVGQPIDKEELEFGDLVYFRTRRYAPITHVGIYIADMIFAHASSGKGVTFSSLESSYYARKYKGARRLTSDDIAKLEGQIEAEEVTGTR